MHISAFYHSFLVYCYILATWLSLSQIHIIRIQRADISHSYGLLRGAGDRKSGAHNIFAVVRVITLSRIEHGERSDSRRSEVSTDASRRRSWVKV